MAGFIALAGLSGCATSYAVAPEAIQGQGIRYEHGAPTVVSVKEHGVLRVSPSSKQFAGRLILDVVAFNNGPSPANIGYENISVSTGAGAPMRLYTASELEKEARSRAAWAAFAVALAGAAQTYSAQQSAYSYGYGSVSTRTPYGGIHSTYNYRTYNPALANVLTQRAAADTSAGIYQISAALDQAISSIEGRILQTTTVDVGAINGGQIVIEKPRMAKDALTDIVVQVAFNGDVHTFRFRAGAEQQVAQLPIPAATSSAELPASRSPQAAPPTPGAASPAPAQAVQPPPPAAAPSTPVVTKTAVTNTAVDAPAQSAKPCGAIPQRNGTQ
jgi:hypothetical protein